MAPTWSPQQEVIPLRLPPTRVTFTPTALSVSQLVQYCSVTNVELVGAGAVPKSPVCCCLSSVTVQRQEASRSVPLPFALISGTVGWHPRGAVKASFGNSGTLAYK
jgi:hypothetical protein